MSVSFENADFGELLSAVRHCETKYFQFGHKERRARSGRRGYAFDLFVRVGADLFDDVDEALAAGDVNEFIQGIKEQIVCVMGNGNSRNQTATWREVSKTSSLAGARHPTKSR